MKRIASCGVILALLASPKLGALQINLRGLWFVTTPMPSARQEISTAVLNGRIFVIGGYNSSGNSTDTVEVFDPTNSQWSSAAPLPIVTNHNAAAVAAGKLYALGGTSNRVFVYDPQQNTWTDVAPMRFQHGNTPAVAVINDHLYVAGGTDAAGATINELEVYDPVANAWTRLAAMNVPRNHTAGGAINGKFYVVGGRGSAEAANALEVYDPQTNTWLRLAAMPTGRSGIGAGVVNGELYVFGGEQPRLFSEVEVYNPLDNRWQPLPPMPTPRHGLFASVIGSAIYLPGGATQQGFGATNINEVFLINTAVTVSAASYGGPPFASQAMVAAFGGNLATTTQAATTSPLPTSLGGTTLRVKDSTGAERLAPLFFVSPHQVNYQIPTGTITGPATMTVMRSDGVVSTGTLQITSAAPSLFTLNQSGAGPAAALDGFTFTLEPFAATRATGEPNIIAFFGTGLGPDATDVDGDVSASVQVRIDGNPAVVSYAGRAPGFIGLNQLNVVLPAGITSGVHTVAVTRNGMVSNTVTIAIR